MRVRTGGKWIAISWLAAGACIPIGQDAGAGLRRSGTWASYDVSQVLRVHRPHVQGLRLFGGSKSDRIADTAADSLGYIYVTGSTDSSDLPTRHAAQSRFQGSDAFVAKFDPSGTELVYATFLGGPCGPGGARDDGNAIAVDAAGNAYIAGVTYSHDFPTTASAFKPERAPEDRTEAFVAKLGPTGTLEYSTHLGGSVGLGGIGGNLTGDDVAEDIAVDDHGNVYVTGYTDAEDFPLEAPTQSKPGGGNDAFVTKIDPSGSRILFSTYLGGEGDDRGTAIAVGLEGTVFVAGDTGSGGFPTTPDALRRENHLGSDDGFVTQLKLAERADGHSAYLGGLVFSTLLGGSGNEYVGDLVVANDGSPVVAGRTYSADFPTTRDAFQRESGGGGDAFVTRLTAAGDGLTFSTHLGGARDDSATALALGRDDDLYVVGDTSSPRFPLRLSVQDVLVGGHDMFVVRMTGDGEALRWSTLLGGLGRSMYGRDYATAVVARRSSLVVSGSAEHQRLDGVLLTLENRSRPGPLKALTSRSERPPDSRTRSTIRRSS